LDNHPTTVAADVVEVDEDGEEKPRGKFEFLSLPSSGDRFLIPRSLPGLDIMTVMFIEHMPIEVPRDTKFGDREFPTATIYARATGEWDT
jgi:hypothetical protein